MVLWLGHRPATSKPCPRGLPYSYLLWFSDAITLEVGKVFLSGAQEEQCQLKAAWQVVAGWPEDAQPPPVGLAACPHTGQQGPGTENPWLWSQLGGGKSQQADLLCGTSGEWLCSLSCAPGEGGSWGHLPGRQAHRNDL